MKGTKRYIKNMSVFQREKIWSIVGPKLMLPNNTVSIVVILNMKGTESKGLM